jgi:hypothetical protein
MKTWLDRNISPIWIVPIVLALWAGHFSNIPFVYQIILTVIFVCSIVWFSKAHSH